MKKIVIALIFAVLLLAVIIVVTTVDFGALTINILEKTAHIEVTYRSMKGNIFRGYRIEGYNVKLSETDSAYGEIADISYRFKPLSLRLPNQFELNLIEPTVCLRKKTGAGQGRTFTLPQFNVGLKMSVKNGTVLYSDGTSHTIESISGLIFIDLIGPKMYLNTFNVSFTSKEYPIAITNAQLDLRLDDKKLEAPSFKIRGNGILLHGKGMYSFENDEASLTFERATINMERIRLYKGTLNFSGEITYRDGQLLPRIKGTAAGFEPLIQCGFETNMLADTIIVNLFEAEIWDGSLFAQLKIHNRQLHEFEANFSNVNIAAAAAMQSPIVISGYLGYKNERFIGHIRSPADSGLGIDSIVLTGSATAASIILDSLVVFEPQKTLEIKGMVYPESDLTVKLDNLDITEFSRFIPFEIQGIITGACHMVGNFNKPLDMVFTTDLTVTKPTVYGIQGEWCSVNSRDFSINEKSGRLNLLVQNPTFKNQGFEQFMLSVQDREVKIDATRKSDSLAIAAVFTSAWQGTISSFSLIYNRVTTVLREPVLFDITEPSIGVFNLDFIGGSLTGTVSPMNVNLSGGDIRQLGKLMGVKGKMNGRLDASFTNDGVVITGQSINYSGLKNGAVMVKGAYRNKGVVVDSLIVSDDNHQDIKASGFLSFDSSDVRCVFARVGAWVLPFLNKFMVNPRGYLSGDITFQGNLQKFAFTGTGTIEDASFGIQIVAAQFDSFKSDVTFEKNRILFTNAEGKVSTMNRSQFAQANGAPVYAGGYVVIEPRFGCNNYNFDLSFEDAPIQYLPFAYGIGSGNFSVGMKDRISYYNGNITAKQAIVPIEFGMEFPQGEAQAPDNWTTNIRIKGDHNIWLRNRDADIEFGGEVYIIKEHAPLYFTGKLETRRGNYYWLNHVLSITQGTITFIPEEMFDADLDFWAEMNTREGVKIILHFYGPLSEPIFEFFSDPPIYSEQDIVTYLNLNITWRELESLKEGAYVEQILPHSLLSWLESDVSRYVRQYTGLDYFRIETPFFEPESKTKLTVGKYVSRDLFVTYTYDITSFSNEFNVEYFLNDNNEIFIKKGEEGEYSLQYQYRIRF